MERTDNDMTQVPGDTHTFPTIGPEHHDTDRSDECFRPLFNGPQGDKDTRATSPCDAEEDGQANDPLAVALKESYQRGVEAGNKEACGLAQREIEPALERFFSDLNTFSDNYAQLIQHSAPRIVALALSIAGKIVNGHALQSSDVMLPVQKALDDMLRHYHQLNLQLNSEDLKELADLMQCRNIEMNNTGAIQIDDSETVQRGVPLSTNAHSSYEEWRERVIQALEELSEGAPSKKASTS